MIAKRVKKSDDVIDREDEEVQEEPTADQLHDDVADGVGVGLVLEVTDYQQASIRHRPDDVNQDFHDKGHRQLDVQVRHVGHETVQCLIIFNQACVWDIHCSAVNKKHGMKMT